MNTYEDRAIQEKVLKIINNINNKQSIIMWTGIVIIAITFSSWGLIKLVNHAKQQNKEFYQIIKIPVNGRVYIDYVGEISYTKILPNGLIFVKIRYDDYAFGKNDFYTGFGKRITVIDYDKSIIQLYIQYSKYVDEHICKLKGVK